VVHKQPFDRQEPKITIWQQKII